MSFTNTRSITFDHTLVPSDRSGLPVLISGTYTWLKSAANGGPVQSSSGYDIGFYSDSALTAKLKWEVVKYVPSTGEIEAWVRIPTLSASVDTVIYLGYGDSSITTFQGDVTATWTGVSSLGATSVWHFADGTTLSVTDSAAATTPTNHGATATTGEIDGAANFVAGSSQYVDTGGDTPFDFEYTDSFTVTAWIKPNITRSGGLTSYALISKRDGSSVGWEMLLTWDGSSKAIIRVNILHSGSQFIQVSGTTDIANGSWAFVGFTYSGTGVASGVKIYVSGVLETMSTGADTLASLSILNAQNLQIGARNAGAFFNGTIDEVRIFPLTRAADGLLTEYRNQSIPSTFYSLGTETATASPAVLALTAAEPAPTPSGSSTTTLTVLALTGAKPAPTASGGSNKALTALALTGTLQTVYAAMMPQIAALALSSSLPAPTASGGAVVGGSDYGMGDYGMGGYGTSISLALMSAMPAAIGRGSAATSLSPLALFVLSHTLHAGEFVPITNPPPGVASGMFESPIFRLTFYAPIKTWRDLLRPTPVAAVDINPRITSMEWTEDAAGGLQGLKVGFEKELRDASGVTVHRWGRLQQPVDVRQGNHVVLSIGPAGNPDSVLYAGRIVQPENEAGPVTSFRAIGYGFVGVKDHPFRSKAERLLTGGQIIREAIEQAAPVLQVAGRGRFHDPGVRLYQPSAWNNRTPGEIIAAVLKDGDALHRQMWGGVYLGDLAFALMSDEAPTVPHYRVDGGSVHITPNYEEVYGAVIVTYAGGHKTEVRAPATGYRRTADGLKRETVISGGTLTDARALHFAETELARVSQPPLGLVLEIGLGGIQAGAGGRASPWRPRVTEYVHVDEVGTLVIARKTFDCNTATARLDLGQVNTDWERETAGWRRDLAHARNNTSPATGAPWGAAA